MTYLTKLLTLPLGLITLSLLACAPPSEDAASEQHIYLVRHAEKVLDVKDPLLTPAGQARAVILKDRLADIDVTAVYSSDYRRTLATAQPLAQDKSLTIVKYDPRDLPGLAARLKEDCAICVVVGHSNTTPQLAAELGGESGADIVEATEYDRLYHIVISRKDAESGEIVTTKIERYGAP